MQTSTMATLCIVIKIGQFQYHIIFCIDGVGVISLIKEVNIHSKEEAVPEGKQGLTSPVHWPGR